MGDKVMTWGSPQGVYDYMTGKYETGDLLKESTPTDILCLQINYYIYIYKHSNQKCAEFIHK